MLKIGITGGIGSGKSLICKIFSLLSIPIYYADERAKELIVEDFELKSKIINLLGNEAYFEDGTYNRRWVANQVFENKELLQQLNHLVHPKVAEDRLRWTALHQNNAPYLLYEAAIMQAAGNGNTFDKVVVVITNLEERIRRIKKRDSFRAEEEIIQIIEKQKTDSEFIKLADFVIFNNPNERVIQQVLELDKIFREI